MNETPADSRRIIDECTIVEEKLVNAKGEDIIKRYSKGKFLGKGGFAKCYEFTNLENNRTMAAKIIPKSTLKKTRH